MRRVILIAILIQAIFIPLIHAQDSSVIVPDISGLNVPQAAALLNGASLELGDETATGWDELSGLQRDTVSGQSVEAGSVVDAGTYIDIEVLRSPNMALVYDDNDLTLVNLSNSVANVASLRFTSAEGNPASFTATRWSTGLREKQCMQVWSISRNQSKGMDGCRYIQNWITTNNTGEHFWTQTNGVQSFSVIEDEVVRAVCPAAPTNSQDSPLRCEFFFSGAEAGDSTTAFIYLIYTPDVAAVINKSNDRWMPTDRSLIYNYNPKLQVQGVSGVFGDPTVLRDEDYTGYGDVTNLAPGQCIMYTTNHPDGMNPPEPCNVIAQRDLSPDVVFWLAEFEIESATDGKTHKCPAASADRPTICIVPQ